MKMRPLLIATGLTGLLVVSGVMTNQSAEARPTFSTTHADPSRLSAAQQFARVHAFDHTTVKAVVRTYTKNGTLLNKRVYHGKAAKAVGRDSGSGGTPSSMGRRKVTIATTGHSTLGFDLWRDKVWVDFNWYNPDHDVSMNDQGRSKEQLDRLWHWEDWQGGDHNYYSWFNNVAGSGYHRMAEGLWSGPCFNPGITCYYNPKEVLNVHADGTDSWSN